MKMQVLTVAAMVAGMLGTSVADACDPPVRVLRRSYAVVRPTCVVVKPTCVVVKPACEEFIELQTLIRLQQPVHVRVVTCCDELAAAKAALAAAVSARDAAAAAETAALERVEATASLLRTMGSCIEINGCVYDKEDVAGAVELLISRYHTAEAAVAAAGELVDLRTVQLTHVEAKVAKWQQKEHELLAQVTSLRIAREVGDVSAKKAAAAKLAGELNGMLSHTPTQRTDVVESTTVTTIVTTPDAATATNPDQVLQDVDQLLQERSGN